MMRSATILILALAACSGGSDDTTRSATAGCLFWSTDCTRLDPIEPTAPLTPAAPRPDVPGGGVTIPPRTGPLPEGDLGRVRSSRPAYARDRAAEAEFDARFTGSKTGPVADSVYPLPAGCSSPPSSLMRNTPRGLAPGGSSPAARTYAQVYDRCRQPGTWPRPN